MNIPQLVTAIADAKARHHAGEELPPGTIKGLANELNRQLTDGAKKCPDCGNRPLAIMQPKGIEIGCTVCRDHRALKPTREMAVEAWNAKEYLPPRGV